METTKKNKQIKPQAISLENSIVLSILGVKPFSYFCYIRGKDEAFELVRSEYSYENHNSIFFDTRLPAFTASEIQDALKYNLKTEWNGDDARKGEEWTVSRLRDSKEVVNGETLQDALCNLIIVLIKTNETTVEELNGDFERIATEL